MISLKEFNQDGLLQSVAVAIFSAGIWLLMRSRRKMLVPTLDQVPGPPVGSWWKGNQAQMTDLKNGWSFHQMLAENYGPVVKLQTVFRKNVFYTYDPKAMNHILLKEVNSYPALRIEFGNVILGNGLLDTVGEVHRRQRKMLNPVFSIAYMRSIMPMFNDIAQKLENTLNKKVQNGPAEASVSRAISSCVSILISFQCRLTSSDGWLARRLSSSVNQDLVTLSTIWKMMCPSTNTASFMKNLVPALSRITLYTRTFHPLLVKIFSAKTRTLLMNAVPWKAIHEVRDMVMYMHEFSVKVYEEKKRALEEGDEAVTRQLGQGKDILSILMKDNINAGAEDKLEEDEIIAQMSTFIFAAMDTTSNAMSRLLQLLTLHPDVQDKLRQEISQARRERAGENLSYDELVALPYLDAVCRETLRLYPPLSHVFRRAIEDSVVPLSKPVRGVDGQEITEVFRSERDHGERLHHKLEPQPRLLGTGCDGVET
ncbi:cytochrome P450 [Gymnopus androsaceus JB14]|uniref:Cytochrome P450 n=1 Tax=Gymnopus androsaceus JB14 TaxID=1447944 RepID=A0A6A4GZ68_9AGAR|nr:cytochrome P450 [Gymnopus androsaceus JB14]